MRPNTPTEPTRAIRDQQLDPLRRALSRCIRAIAKRRQLEIAFQTDQPEQQGRVVLPALPQRLSPRDFAVLRGASDAAALRLAHHDENLHRVHRPAEPAAAAIFDALEQARVESIGARQMDGIAANLLVMLQERYLQPEYSAATPDAAPLPDALALLVRQHLIDGFSTLRPQLLQVWHPRIAAAVEPVLHQLDDVVGDQAAFAALALSMIDSVRQDLRPTNIAAEPVEDEAEAQGEQEPGPIEGGDRSLGPAEGTKSANDEAIGEEPIFGNAEKAKAPGYDSLADQPLTDQPDVSEPSRRVVRAAETDPDKYQIFTRQFDEEVSADELVGVEQLARLRAEIDSELRALDALVARLANRLQRSLIAQQKRFWEHDLELDTLDASRLTRVITDPLSELLYKRETEGPVRDTVVTLLLDNSGSMRGRPSMIVAICADLVARALERCGIKVEILGFTTRTWRGGRAREAWIDAGCPANPGRLNEARHVIYKPADAPWRRTRHNLGLLMLAGFHKENIDGEALAWAHQRLAVRPEQRRVLMMISDGAPVDDATLAASHAAGNYLEQHLRRVIDDIGRIGLVELFAIGIGYDVGRFYPQALTIKDVDELGPALIGELGRLLDHQHHAGSPQRRRGRSSH
jgi:cobaltochelatase CobT